jgi:hypothetical protein
MDTASAGVSPMCTKLPGGIPAFTERFFRNLRLFFI